MIRRRGARKSRFFAMVPWCSGLAYVPVKDEIAGSNPVGTAHVNVERDERSHLESWTHGDDLANRDHD
jgi:hypothetical protein